MPDDQIQREIEFRQTTMENLGRFSVLYKRCFDKVVDERYFAWKYCDNPAGPFVGFEAVHQGKTIASYGVIPEPYLVKGAPVRAWQSMDTMTDPDYQRRGLFIELAKRTYRHLATIDPDYLITGVPGPMSVRGFLDKLSWHDVGSYPAMFTHRSVLALTGRRASVSVHSVTSMTDELRAYLSNRPRPSTAITTDFTPEFFAWRVFNSMSKSFKVHAVSSGGTMRGLCVSTRDNRGWVVVHLLDFADPSDLWMTAPVLRRVVAAHGASKIFVLAPRDERRRAAFRRAGLIMNPTNKGPMTYRQPLIAYNPSGRFHGVDASSAQSYDFQQLMQD